jgi:hypothetical protein
MQDFPYMNMACYMDLRELGQSDMQSIHLAQDRDYWQALVNTVMNLQVP